MESNGTKTRRVNSGVRAECNEGVCGAYYACILWKWEQRAVCTGKERAGYVCGARIAKTMIESDRDRVWEIYEGRVRRMKQREMAEDEEMKDEGRKGDRYRAT